MKRVLYLFAIAILLGTCVSAASITIGTFDVDANATFFQQSSNDNCSFSGAAPGCTADSFLPAIIDLSTYGLTAGDELQLIVNGSFCYIGTGTGTLCGTGPLGGIFDTSGTDLLANNVQNRLPNSVNAGLPEIVNSNYNTYYGNKSTTTPNDFYICGSVDMPHCTGDDGTTLIIPAGANYLYIGVLDSFYADNTGDLSVTINEITPDAPEPATFVLLGFGLAAIGLRKLRRA